MMLIELGSYIQYALQCNRKTNTVAVTCNPETFQSIFKLQVNAS